MQKVMQNMKSEELDDKTQCQLCKRLVWKRVSPMDVIARGHSTAIFLCLKTFSAWWQPNKRTTKGDPRARLLLTSEKAVFCKTQEWMMTCCQHWNLSRKTNFALPHPPQSPVFVLKFWCHHGVLRFEMVFYPQKLFWGSKIAMAVFQPDVDRLSWLLAALQQWLPQPLQACLRVSPPGNTLLRKSDDPIIIADFSLTRESDNYHNLDCLLTTVWRTAL